MIKCAVILCDILKNVCVLVLEDLHILFCDSMLFRMENIASGFHVKHFVKSGMSSVINDRTSELCFS